ncbi:hypothetical protein K438DRAFT_914486 [Mycena galopus ATCC 62051]|nr:hypothetical protein K438DRAFT_914486 [Mycena galopus ATCC 62051]
MNAVALGSATDTRQGQKTKNESQSTKCARHRELTPPPSRLVFAQKRTLQPVRQGQGHSSLEPTRNLPRLVPTQRRRRLPSPLNPKRRRCRP